MTDHLRAGDRLTLEVTQIDGEGRGLATHAGREVRIAGAFGGEVVDVELTHVSKGGPVAHARLAAIRTAHPHRRALPCPRHVDLEGRCGGCPLMGLDEDAQREQKAAWLRSLGLEVERVRGRGPQLGYRFASKRVAFGGPGRLQLGSFQRGSHRPAWMRACLVDHPRLSAAADEIEDRAQELAIPAFDERRGDGALRGVWLKTDGEHVVVTLLAGRDAPEVRESLKTLAHRLEVPRGVAFALAQGGAMRVQEAKALRGDVQLAVEGESIAAQGPLAFLQPNPAVTRTMHARLLEDEAGAPVEGTLALDLYAGGGATTRLARARFGEVVPVESHPGSARALGVAPAKVEDALREWSEKTPRVPDLVLANPPRKGLGAAVCAALRALGAPRLHVMSCGPAALARDLAALAPTYRRVSLEAWDTLPQTPHVELLARLVRA